MTFPHTLAESFRAASKADAMRARLTVTPGGEPFTVTSRKRRRSSRLTVSPDFARMLVDACVISLALWGILGAIAFLAAELAGF